MKKRSVIAALLCSMCLTVGSTFPVMADSAKVVTLGADLTQDQKNTMMNYFKADASQVQILTVTNADEREYLGNYIPLEQIGTRTLSCAYVKPTQSGGIKVRTANLNYVTGRMIANALSTAGISNCEAVAACPYEVSGTGALTGVMMAYESASGQKLDSTKKDLATQEVVVTGNLAQQVGEDNATNIINQAKLQIIGQNVQNADEIYNIVNNIAVENNVTFSSEEMDAIVSPLQQIAQQSYDIEQMKTTLAELKGYQETSGEPVFQPRRPNSRLDKVRHMFHSGGRVYGCDFPASGGIHQCHGFAWNLSHHGTGPAHGPVCKGSGDLLRLRCSGTESRFPCHSHAAGCGIAGEGADGSGQQGPG